MRIREDNRNLVLLTTVALCCAMVAGTAELIGPSEAPARIERVAVNAPAVAVEQQPSIDQASVRVVGTKFVPNVNPRER